MAVESRIDADDEWFVGEDRVLNFTMVKGDVAGITGWTIVFELFERRAKQTDLPVRSFAAVGHDATAQAPARVTVLVDATQTASLPAGIYQYVLRRTDEGARAILGFGPADLRSAVNA